MRKKILTSINEARISLFLSFLPTYCSFGNCGSASHSCTMETSAFNAWAICSTGRPKSFNRFAISFFLLVHSLLYILLHNLPHIPLHIPWHIPLHVPLHSLLHVSLLSLGCLEFQPSNNYPSSTSKNRNENRCGHTHNDGQPIAVFTTHEATYNSSYALYMTSVYTPPSSYEN